MRVVRFSGVCLLLIYVFVHLLFPTVLSELFIYNLVPVAAIVGIAFAPHVSDRVTKPSAAIAVAF